MSDDEDDDRMLETFFDAGRARGGLDPDFAARLEAAAERARPGATVVSLRPRASFGPLAGAGLLAAGLAGVAIGLSVPETLNGVFGSVTGGTEIAEFLPATDPAALWGDLE